MDDDPGAGPVLGRAEQRRRFGMDCGDAIRFEAGAWTAGGEHVRRLTVRNVGNRSLKFTYELPSTKFFSMAFPTVATLSAGMQTALDVTFRPVRLEEYDDFVGFRVHVVEGGVTITSGRFRVPVTARVASLSVALPSGLDMGFCPTREVSRKTFALRNTGQLDALFEWKLAGAGEHGQPLAIEPVAGRVPAGESIELTASFEPTTAAVYVTTTVCNVRADVKDDSTPAKHVQETMKISGISKFTHLSASETELNFGDALVGAPPTATASPGLVATEKEFVLRNRSLVRASFRVRSVESDHDAVFSFSPTSGVVDPESTVTVKVRYTPLSAGTFTCDHFDFTTPGSNTVRVTCKGRAVGPVVTLWKKNAESNFVQTRSINFQDVAVGSQPATRVITLRNESPLEVLYHLDAQEDGVFRFDGVSGRIPPFLDRNVTVTFSPTQAGNFYRRFFLLLMNQTTQYIDVLGTGYDDKTRPSPFQQAHVDAYRARLEAGLGLLSPDQLENYQQDHGDALFLKGAVKRVKEEDARRLDGVDTSSSSSLPPPSALQTRSGEATLAEVEVAHEYFVTVDDRGNPVVVTLPQMDFGNCSIVQQPSKKLLHVTNNTHGKVTCSWRVATCGRSTEANSQSIDAKKAFQVFPETSDIAAGATAEFRVAFQPTQSNAYYFAELEGYVAFKSNRTFRLVNVGTFTPPWCVTSKAIGNTFPSPTEQFLAKVRFRVPKHKVHFPPCHLGDSVFQTLAIENASDTPALFSFAADPSQVFQCKPSVGFIPAKAFHLVAVRFSPRQVRSYSHMMHCVVNNAYSKPEELELAGICALPRLALPDCVGQTDATDAKVFIKPTAVGLQSLRKIQVVNTSRVPLVFRWEVPRKYQGEFVVRPKLGRLNGCESATIECTFSPSEVRDYASRFSLAVKPISLSPQEHKKAAQHSSIPVLQELSVRAVTKGTVGAIRFHPRELTFATVLVHTSSKQHLVLENTADCDLVYRLEPTLLSTSSSSDRPSPSALNEADGKPSVPAALEFSESRGCIPAQSRKKIAVTFQPSLAGKFAFRVSCELGDQGTSSVLSPWDVPDRREAACIIRGDASFPTIEIQDIRVPGASPALAWQQFQCNGINRFMAAPLPSEGDDDLDTDRPRSSSSNNGVEQPEVLSTRSTAAQQSHFVLPFSPAPLGSPPEQAFLLVRNPGNLVVEFSLRLPKEGSVEMEHWAETGAPSPEEVRTNAIIDAKVFGLSPRRATLQPQESVLLTLSYAYNSQLYGGVHDLPIRLEVDKGKQLTLELHGTTLAPREPKLFVPTHVFHLSPVMIGEHRRRLPVPERADEYRNEPDHCHWSHYQTSSSGRTGGPPVQQIQVFNRGGSAFRLDVGSNSFERVNAESYGYPVLSCSSTSEIVPAKSAVCIDVVFNPVESKTVRADLILKAHGLMGKAYKEAVMVTVVATAFHPKQWTLQQLRREQLLSTPAPRRQLLSVPGRAARFAVDSVDFGHVPMHSQVHRLLILTNDCGSQAVDACAFVYQWDQSHPLVADGTVAFSPTRGELAPGDKVLIRVSIQTTSQAVVVNHAIPCLVTYAPPEVVTDSGNQRGGSMRKEPAARTSVIHRSTATQEAATVDGSRSPAKTMRDEEMRKSQTSTAMSKPSSKKKASEKTVGSEDWTAPTSSSTLEPVFVHIYAHALPDAVFEKYYPREVVQRLPLPTSQPLEAVVPSAPTSSHGSRSTRMPLTMTTRSIKTPSTPKTESITSKTEGEASKCHDTVMDVVEALVVDVLNSGDVQSAMDEQLGPLSRSDRAVLLASTATTSARPRPLFPAARKSDDCQAILANVLENSVANVLQELFHGDLERELLCLPRKAVFPGSAKAKGAAPRPLDR